MKKYVILILTVVLISFSGVKKVSAGEIIYSEIKDNTISVFAELPDSQETEKRLLIDEKTAKISSFSDSPSVNTIFLTDRSAVLKDSKEEYCRIIRNILETDGENDKFSFVSFDDQKVTKDVDFTVKQLDILNAAEKLIYEEGSMALTEPVDFAEKMFENADESFCRIILFTKTENIKSFKSFEKYKYPLYAVLTDVSENSSVPDVSEFENAGMFFRYCRCIGKTDPDSISDFIVKNSKICRISAVIPEKLPETVSDRTVVLELSTDDAKYSFSQKAEIPSVSTGVSAKKDGKMIFVPVLFVFLVLVLVFLSFAALVSVKKKKKTNHASPSGTLNVSGTAVIAPKKGKGTLVSNAGTKMLFEDTGEYRIVLTGKGNNNRNIVLVSSKETIIGRNQYQADEIIYDERSVSQKHCRIYTRENRVFVEDLNSLNHTFVNGNEIKDETEITTGSVLKIGRIEFDVQIIFSR